MRRFTPGWSELGAAAAAVERWLLPGECLVCRARAEAIPADPLLCAACRARLAPLSLPQCSRCGQPLTPEIECRLCAAWPPGLSGVQSAVWLGDTARETVHRFKYLGWWRLAEPMAEVMRARLAMPPDATLVPIPLSAARERTRGYNQSAVLADSLGRLLHLPVQRGALCRRRETTTQTALTPEERRANLSGAFAALDSPPPRPVLVDDVFTTGATLAEAALALLHGGASHVTGVTFARAPRPLDAAWESPFPLADGLS